MILDWNRDHVGDDMTPSNFSGEFDDEADEPAFRAPGGTDGDRLYHELEIARHRMTDPDRWNPDLVTFADSWRAFKADFGVIDFTDMIEFGAPTAHQPGVIIADEAQDLSRLERAYLERMRLATGAALVLVGDAYQAIYVWRGADPDILFDPATDHTDTLTQSYRVSAAVHEAASRWIRRIPGYRPVEYRPRDEPGQLLESPSCVLQPDDALDIAESRWKDGHSVMLLATSNQMVDALVYELRERRLPFGNPWRTRRGQWNPLAPRRGVTMRDRLLAFTRPADTSWEDRWTYRDLADFSAVLAAKGLFVPGGKGRLVAAAADSDFASRRPEADDVLDYFERAAVAEMIAAIDSGRAAEWWYGRMLSSRERTARYPVAVYQKHGRKAISEPIRHGSKSIFVGTIHSVKGGEADTVILFPDIPWPAELARQEGPEGVAALIRLFYVGMTRARQDLVLCAPSDRRGWSSVEW